MDTAANAIARARDIITEDVYVEISDVLRAQAAKEGSFGLLEVAAGLDERCELFTDWMHLDDAGSDEHARIAFEEAKRQGLFGL